MRIVTRTTAPRLLTAAQFLRLGPEHERSELWDGVVVVRDSAGCPHGVVSAELVYRLGAHVKPRRLGRVLDSSTGFLLARNPDRVLCADAAFVSRERLPTMPARGFTPCAPDLCAEVRSPSDPWSAVIAKAGIWIAHGVRVVWAIDPEDRRVTTFRPFRHPVEARGGGRISGAPALPRLSLRVDDLFRDL
jgi:Uma2 family endonuclease